ncbi:MAG: TIGR01777 family oxidoreductase [Salinibacterium sp.]|nr:TIGR01777 family oxidoreductase [Salinibacterium sp.]
MAESKPASMRVLVSGASGFIGTEVCRQLEADGHSVLSLVRRAPETTNEYQWSPAEQTIDAQAIESADAVINLAGATTGRLPWTSGYKKEILYSRVNGTRTIAEAIARAEHPPAVFLSGSAVGYYGDQPGVTLTEASPKGVGFLSDVVEAWEQAADLTPTTTRLVKIRTGVVVGQGGAFTPLIPLTKLGLGSRFGSGKQHWPWISLHDEAAAIRHLLTSSMVGVVNLAGPTPATSEQITRALAKALGRWHPFVVPEFALKALGDAGQDLLLSSERVEPVRLTTDGFEFRHSTVDAAIAAFISR